MTEKTINLILNINQSSTLFSFEQIVIHSLQCTHYVILWHLAKLSEGSSRKVRSPEANFTVPLLHCFEWWM